MARDAAAAVAAKISTKPPIPYITTIIPDVRGAVGIDRNANETYNLTNIGTLFASAGSRCAVRAIPTEPPRPFSCLGRLSRRSVLLCVYVIVGLPVKTWIRRRLAGQSAGALRRVRIQTQQDPQRGSGAAGLAREQSRRRRRLPPANRPDRPLGMRARGKLVARFDRKRISSGEPAAAATRRGHLMAPPPE